MTIRIGTSDRWEARARRSALRLASYFLTEQWECDWGGELMIYSRASHATENRN